MKLAELKNRFQNRYVIRIVAGVLTVALVGTGIVYTGKAAANAAPSGTETAVSTEVTNVEEISEEGKSLNLENMITTGESQVGKEETVYLISGTDGAVKQTIVMDHLFNQDGAATLEDETTLSDIQNVKGNETFTQNGQKLTWQADGKDIYYRGSSQEQTPVTQKVTYYLDGEEIAPEELAGKSGKVTIRFDYENHAVYTEEVNGEKIEVKVPFAAITGLVLDDNFSNIQVTNGKIKQNGDSNVVMGYALPGLAESLKVEESDFSEEVELPEYFEVSADVEKFSLSTAMTFVVNATDFTDLQGISTADLDEKIAELSDASGQLEDGSKELADGVNTLKNSLGDFSDGMKELSNGLNDYTDGSEQINSGILQVKDGVDLLAGSKDALSSGISQLKDGSASAADGADALVSGSSSLLTGTKKLNSGASDLAAGTSALADGASALASGASDVNSGASALASGTTDLLSGIGELSKGVDQVNSGASDLAAGAAQLDAGVDLLVDTLGDMSQELSDNEAAILSQFQTDAIKGLLAQLDAKYADGVTAENLAEVTQAVAENEAVLLGTLQYLGYDQATAQATYDNLLSGLYQAQGAISVLTSISEKLESNTSNVEALAAGSESLKQGAAQLSQGTAQLSQGTSQLSQGAAQLDQGAAQLSQGTAQLSQGASDLSGGAKALDQGASALYSGTTELQAGAKQLYDGNKSLATGLGTLDEGLGSLSEKVPVLVQGITSLKDGVDTLADGSNTLVSNNGNLLDGMKQLLNGTGQIVDGVDQLDDGSRKLADGMQQFNEEAIDQLVNSYNGDVKSLTNRLQAVLDAGNEYQTYTALAEGTTGSVKFIYKLESIKAE